MTMQLTSPAFTEGGLLPARYTCHGPNMHPPLAIGGVPGGAGSLVLLMDDPDAPDPAGPREVWDHWVVWNLPPGTNAVAEGRLPPGAREGRNSWGTIGYRGPCPERGTHRYFFKVYALDRRLTLDGAPSRTDVEEASRGRVLARARLMGRYRARR